MYLPLFLFLFFVCVCSTFLVAFLLDFLFLASGSTLLVVRLCLVSVSLMFLRLLLLDHGRELELMHIS